MNWYEVLGIGQDASVAEIRQAHRQAVRASHPDVVGHRDAEAELRAANAAWAVLSNPERRAAYDAALQRGQHTIMPPSQVKLRMSDAQIARVVARTKATQDKRTREMVRIGITGVAVCLVLLIFLSGLGA